MYTRSVEVVGAAAAAGVEGGSGGVGVTMAEFILESAVRETVAEFSLEWTVGVTVAGFSLVGVAVGFVVAADSGFWGVVSAADSGFRGVVSAARFWSSSAVGEFVLMTRERERSTPGSSSSS